MGRNGVLALGVLTFPYKYPGVIVYLILQSLGVRSLRFNLSLNYLEKAGGICLFSCVCLLYRGPRCTSDST